MHKTILAITVAIGSSQAACASQSAKAKPTPIIMGDGHVDGKAIQPYDFTWAQCSLKDGEWQSGPPMSERLDLIGDDVVRLRRVTNMPTGAQQAAAVYFERASLSPRRMEVAVYAPDGSKQLEISQALSKDGHLATMIQGDAKQSKTGEINSTMYDGSALGLPLTTLDYTKGPYGFDSSMMSMKGTYKTVASFVGTESINFGDKVVEAELIDVEWLHNESGDVYKPGPNESGGRYWLVKNPPEGFPHVPRYQTDTYAVEFVQGVCPSPAEAAQD